MNDLNYKIELLRLAFEITKSENTKQVFYVDVANLGKVEAEKYMDSIIAKFKSLPTCTCDQSKGHGCSNCPNPNTPSEKSNVVTIPRREGGHGTKLETIPGKASLEDVLKTAYRLAKFEV